MTEMTLSSRTISLDDFMTGFLASLAQRGIKTVSIRDTFYEALADAFPEFQEEARRQGYEVDFVVKAHPVHRDSPTVRMGISQAVQRDLISLDNPVYLDMRVRISPEYADDYLETLPGQPQMYLNVTDRFLKEFRDRTGA